MTKIKLNLKYYKGSDCYSDGDVEEDIIKHIKEHSDNDLHQAFAKDKRWATYYHLSRTRQNILNWYPFKKNATILEIGAGMGAITEVLCDNAKKVTCVELSKRRANAILERNKNKTNLEIIVGNLNDIKISEKFDYITLIGVLEYAPSFTEGDNPFETFLKSISKYLKNNGKLLIAIENRFGLKYWCGAKEDHTSITYEGINNYPNTNNVKTFSKAELSNLLNEVGLKSNFYYPLPDYKFPEVILTDEYLNVGSYINYVPYYCNLMNLFLDENKIYRDLIKNKELPFFANSYFVEASLNELQQKEITFVKFNSQRKKEFNLMTYFKDNKVYKKALQSEGKMFLNEMIKNYRYLEKKNIHHLPLKIQNEQIYTDLNKGQLLSTKMNLLWEDNKKDLLIKEIQK